MAFWKPGTIAPGSNVPVSKGYTLDRETEKETEIMVHNSHGGMTIQQQRVRLPIFKCKLQILYCVETYQVTIIVGETGCGKTTQIPQYLQEAGWTTGGRVIACTQPRRVAATSVAARVAEETGTVLGKEVGYSIRFDDCTDEERTQIKYLTDGMLLRETMVDPLLSKYSVIMIDEAHERSLYTDILLGLLKKILKKRKDLRVVVSSATIDAENVKEFFNTNTTGDSSKDNVVIMSIEGRTFPVDIHYTFDPVPDYIQATVNTIMDIHKFQPPGDILAFLTGQEEIDTVVTLVKEKASDMQFAGTMKMKVLPMYSGLSSDKVMEVFEPTPKNVRKVIIATNIAETSVTIDGIVYVIDCGFEKIRAYNPRLGIETLLVAPIAQANANQRAGRAGRNRPGKCYRLYTSEAFKKFDPSPVPEMQRTNLATVVLQLKALGIDNVLYFDFMSSPPAENMIRALEILYSLGAIDNEGKLTDPVGTTMCEFPVDPFMARMLLNSGEKYHCSEEILTIASLLSVQALFNFSGDSKKKADAARRKFAVYEGDHLTLLNVYNAFLRSKKSPDWCKHHHIHYRALMRAIEIRNQLKKYLKRWRVPILSADGDSDKIVKCIVSGYFANAAKLQPDGSFKTIRDGQTLHMHPTSVLYNRTPEWVVYHEVVQTNKVFMREISVIQPSWLHEVAPNFYEFQTKSAKHQASLNETESAQPPSKIHRVVF